MSCMYDELDPINNPIHALRLEFGDVDEYDYILSDQSYQYFIDKYPSSRVRSKYLGMAIRARFASEGYRQRVGQEEAYLGERYKNYTEWLKDKITNPMLNGNVPKVYVGGVVRETVADYETRMDLIDAVFYRGQGFRQPDWTTYRQFNCNTVNDPEELKTYQHDIGI